VCSDAWRRGAETWKRGGGPLQGDRERNRIGQPHGGERRETLHYIKEMLEQLGAMARAEKCETLAYFIEMACIEADDIARTDAARGGCISEARKKGNGPA